MSNKSNKKSSELSSLEKGERSTECNTVYNRQHSAGINIGRILLPLVFFLWIKVALGSKDDWTISEPIGTVVWNPCTGPTDLPGSECGYIMCVFVVLCFAFILNSCSFFVY